MRDNCRAVLRSLPALLPFILAVSLQAATLCVDPHGAKGCYSTIPAAIAAASPGDIVQVRQGTYPGAISLTKSLTLQAAPGAKPVIDANGRPNGIVVNIFSPNTTEWTWSGAVQGFEVKNALFEGILVINAFGVVILDNYVHSNDQALDVSTGTCPGLNTTLEPNEQANCGGGIHLIGANVSSVLRNLVEDNAVGILVTDETVASGAVRIAGNLVRDNSYDGILFATYPPFHSVSYSAIERNRCYHNGTIGKSGGAGILLFSPNLDGFNLFNSISYNDLRENSGPGVAFHQLSNGSADEFSVPVGGDILGNYFSGNGPDTGAFATSGSTGINIHEAFFVNVFSIQRNQFADEAIDIAFLATDGSTVPIQFNDFGDDRGVGISWPGSGATSVLNGTYNWWGCPVGSSFGCRYLLRGGGSDVGTTIVAPALTDPLDLKLR
ncbi:NosD domain-containing protein [Silvibacterium acidisoli]|uniref:NosD domain-containing protein n=1 Tax=Acidobacteriaceae bacterium ZG23-2 TaxID=2883246 RepID=UPI00406CF449